MLAKEKWLIFDAYKYTIKTFIHCVRLWVAVKWAKKTYSQVCHNRWLEGAQRLADGPILVVTRIIDRGHFELLRFRPCIFFVSHFLSFRFTRISPIESLRCNYLKGREGGTGKPWYHTGRVRPYVSRHGHGIGFPWSNFIFYFVLSEKYYIPNKF